MTVAEMILNKYDEQVSKAALTTATQATAVVIELGWADTMELYGNDETPLVSSLAHTNARAVQHRWRERTRRAAASNTSNENAAAKSGVNVTPAPKSNTSQIIKGTVEVSRSAKVEAANGIYGQDAIDMIAMQVEDEVAGIYKDMEYSLLFGVESTTDPRMMDGLIGAAGTYAGVIQTTQNDLSEAALSEANFKTFLETIWLAQAGKYPDTVLCSLEAANVINAWATPGYRLNVTLAELAELPAGKRVTQYVAPWGGLVDIVPHPLCDNSATPANNWLAAIVKPRCRIAEFDPLQIRQLNVTSDGDQWEIIWEGTLEARVESGHGILHNIAEIS